MSSIVFRFRVLILCLSLKLPESLTHYTVITSIFFYRFPNFNSNLFSLPPFSNPISNIDIPNITIILQQPLIIIKLKHVYKIYQKIELLVKTMYPKPKFQWALCPKSKPPPLFPDKIRTVFHQN